MVNGHGGPPAPAPRPRKTVGDLWAEATAHRNPVARVAHAGGLLVGWAIAAAVVVALLVLAGRAAVGLYVALWGVTG